MLSLRWEKPTYSRIVDCLVNNGRCTQWSVKRDEQLPVPLWTGPQDISSREEKSRYRTEFIAQNLLCTRREEMCVCGHV